MVPNRELSEGGIDHVRSDQVFDELADPALPNRLVEALVDCFLQRDREFPMHRPPQRCGRSSCC